MLSVRQSRSSPHAWQPEGQHLSGKPVTRLKATRILVRETKGKVFVMGRADQGPIALALASSGPEKFFLAAADFH